MSALAAVLLAALAPQQRLELPERWVYGSFNLWWVEAAKAGKGAIGIMYTTWERDYGDLERFIEAIGRHR